MTYGQIAAILGNPNAPRAVATALRNVPREVAIPCHRVVSKTGRPAPADVFGGPGVQRQVLMAEGVPFLADGRIDMRAAIFHPEVADMHKIADELAQKALDMGFLQAKAIDIDSIAFKDEVRDMCAANTCGMYGTNWQCPPGVGEVAELAQKAKGYTGAVLVNSVWELEDSFDFEGMQAGSQGHKQMFDRLRREASAAAGSGGIWAMGAGGCSRCSRCSYLDGEPCCMPEEVVASMEACGIHVLELSKACGFNYINGKNTVTYFGLILL